MVTLVSVALLSMSLGQPLVSIPSPEAVDAAWKRVREAEAPFAGKVLNDRLVVHWLDSSRLWYRATRPDGVEYVLANAAKGTRGPAFDHGKLATLLSQATGKPADPARLRLEGLEFSGNDQLMGLTLEGKRYTLTDGAWKQAVGNASDKKPGERLQPVPGRARSGASDADTSISFDNQTKETVEIFWVDSEGGRKSYGKLAPGKVVEQHTFASHVWSIRQGSRDLGSFRATALPGRVVIDGVPAPARVGGNNASGRRPAAPADGKVFARDHHLFLKGEDGTEKPLTTDGTATDGYRGAVHVAPDGRHAIAMRTLAGDTRKLTLVESSPRDQLQPRILTVDYPKPGDAINRDMPHLFNLQERREIPLDQTPWENPWSNDRPQWSPDSTRFWFLHNRRGHQVLRLIEIEAATGKSRRVVEEKSSTFIDYAHKTWLRILPGKNRVVWMSERSGNNHLHQFEISTGKELAPVTRGNWVVREVEKMDEATGVFRLKVGGIHAGQDPYHVHFATASLDGGEPTILTDGDGTHEVEDGPGGQYMVARHSRVDLPTRTELRDAKTGKLVVVLERNDTGALQKAGWRAPERFVSPARDGKTPIFGVIYKPLNFDPARKYPVIEYIYAGPQDAFVPKGFRLMHNAQRMAEIGAIVVQIDGMGTSRRSKAFHDVCSKNLADAGFPDRKLWIRAAAATRPYMDLGRVGIYGGSAGGQNALRALLSHSDFYHAAAADCGCHDNRIDKIWWNELWMGWPIGPHYEAQAAQTDAARLKGKLLLTVGEVDRNVDPACTLRVVKALIEAGKTFEYLVLPGLGHGAGESPFAARERVRFFMESLDTAR